VTDFLDFMLAINFLARTNYDKKLKLLFELCDDDDDGCMTPDDILNMLQRVKRVFAQECAKVDFESTILNNFVADKKAECNFHQLMGEIKNQNLQKQIKLKLQQDKNNKERGEASKKQKAQVEPEADEENEDNLITYREFINAIKNLSKLYSKILPRTLSFRDVLNTKKTERTYHLTDVNAEDFAMFRYEVNSIFKLHQFQEETSSELFMGRYPLSRKMGKQIKDLEDKDKYQDMFRPPGLVEINQYYFDEEDSKTV